MSSAVYGWLLSLLAVAYLGCLFGIAFFGDRSHIYPNHTRLRPYIYSVALGVDCTSWTFFGAVGSAMRDGWGYLPIYFSPTLVFLFGLPRCALRCAPRTVECYDAGMRAVLLFLAAAATPGGSASAGSSSAESVSAGGDPAVRAPAAALQPAAPADAFAQLKALSGDWEADLPGYGKMQDTVRLISNGTAIEETIGTAADNEASIYTREGDRILMTHYCAMTPDGHQVRLETAALQRTPDRLEFVLVGSTNLHNPTEPHMRLLSMTLVDRDHFSERWTKTEAGKDTVFEMSFTRR